MIYVNGDGFAAACYAANQYAVANEDIIHFLKGEVPHPINLSVSFAKVLSNILHQPLRIEANYKSCQAKIFRETMTAIENSRMISHVVITWPNFYRGEVWQYDTDVQFEFGQKNNLITNRDVLKDIESYLRNFSIENAYKEFNRMLEELCEEMDRREIRYVMAMSNYQFDSKFGNWVVPTVEAWAKPLEFLNPNGYLTTKGHMELAKLMIPYLTNPIY
jgi:hypothetical protein